MEHLKINTGQGVDVHLSVAGLGVRSYAFVVDWHIRTLLALAWFAMWLLFIDLSKSVADNFSDIIDGNFSIAFYLVIVPPALIYFLYHPLLEIIMDGRTPGKRMANICIVTGEGLPLSVGAHLIRNIFRIVDSLPVAYCLGIIICLLNKRQLRLGDFAAGATLVYEESAEGSAMQDVDHFLTKGNMSLEQLKAVRELVQRWKQLDQAVRGRLAKQLLKKINEEGLETDNLTDKELFGRLKTLLER